MGRSPAGTDRKMMRWESRKTAEGLAVNRERDACICNGPKANKSSGITPIDIPCECRWIVIIQFRRGPEAHFRALHRAWFSRVGSASALGGLLSRADSHCFDSLGISPGVRRGGAH